MERLFEEQASLKNGGRSEVFHSPRRKHRVGSSGVGEASTVGNPVPSARGLAHRMRPRGNPSPQPRSLDRSAAFGKCPNTPLNKPVPKGLLGGETDANHCHTDANHCHILPSLAQSDSETLSSSPEP